MAHIQKYKAHSVGHMLAHYRRDESSLGRDNIDPTLTHLNETMNFVENPDPTPNWSTIESRIADVDAAAAAAGKRRTRKDAVVMADLVLTLPEDVLPGDEEEFFEAAFDYFGDKFGHENVLGGFVHRDEMRTVKDPENGTVKQTGERVRDHIHIPFTPIMNGRFNYKGMVPRTFYKTMHRELGDAVEKALGYRPSVTLDSEDKVGKVLSKINHEDLIEAREAIVKPAEEEAARAREMAAREVQAAQIRLECLQQDETQARADIAELDRSIGQADAFINDAKRFNTPREVETRADGFAIENSQLRARVSQLEGERDHLKQRVGRVEQGVHELRAGVRGLRARLKSIQQAINRLVGEVIAACWRDGVTQIRMEPRGLRTSEIPDLFRGAAADGFGPAYTPPARTPNEVKSRAVAAARSAEIGRRQRGSSHSRGRGIDR